MMRNIRLVKGVLIGLATVGLLIPAPLLAAGPAAKPVVVDVALRDGGVLLGQVVDPQGVAKADAPVSLRYEDRELVTTNAGPDGYFAVKGLRGGVHQVATQDGHGVYRLWAAGTAPPSAQDGVLLVSGSSVTRGQQGGGGLKTFLANPLVIAGIVATAVAVPVALHNSRSSSPASP